MERLFDDGSISEIDLERIYAGAFLGFYVFVERSIERLFVGILLGRLTFARGDVAPLITVRSATTARAVLAGGRNYVDWLPYRDTKDRAKAFLSGGRPFKSLETQHEHALNRMGVLRNAIAHDSSHSLRSFRRVFLENVALPPRQQRPAGYLRGQYALDQTRFDFLLAQAVAAMKGMCE